MPVRVRVLAQRNLCSFGKASHQAGDCSERKSWATQPRRSDTWRLSASESVWHWPLLLAHSQRADLTFVKHNHANGKAIASIQTDQILPEARRVVCNCTYLDNQFTAACIIPTFRNDKSFCLALLFPCLEGKVLAGPRCSCKVPEAELVPDICFQLLWEIVPDVWARHIIARSCVANLISYLE